MKNLFVLFTVFVALILLTGTTAFAQMAHEHGSSAQTTVTPTQPSAEPAAPVETRVVNAGNKTCPITGEAVNGTDFVTYKGVRYGLCCAACKEQFLKEPEKFIQKLRDKGEVK